MGSTNDITRRVKEHNLGKVISTKNHRPLTLVYTQGCKTETDARALEKKIKSKRLLKEEIIRNIEK